MKILLCYVTVTNGAITADYVSRFVGTWLAFPPGVQHETIVACNGGPPSREIALMFDPLGATFYPKPNDAGWDIGAYQDIAHRYGCDMLVCMGESCYFHREGWLKKIVDAWDFNGPGMYGFFSSYLVSAHMNTTAFATAPMYLQRYPRVTSHKDRYTFEHHETEAFWRKVHAMGRPTKFVTWDGVWDPFQWRYPPNILFRGDQSNLLIYCNHTDRYRAADLPTRAGWERATDSAFK
jgi:hypothetical protein